MPALQRTGKDITEIYNRQVDTVFRICFSFMKNIPDTEDMVQDTFLRLMKTNITFVSEDHEKAWLIVTASNLCRDTLKKWWRKTVDIDDPSLGLRQPPFEIDHVLEAILSLPSDQKIAVYMYYYEGYSSADIAAYLRPISVYCPIPLRKRNGMPFVGSGPRWIENPSPNTFLNNTNGRGDPPVILLDFS